MNVRQRTEEIEHLTFAPWATFSDASRGRAVPEPQDPLRPVFQPDGSYEMHEMLDLGLTIDERLADGYYYSKTIKLLRKLLENPELLETPAKQEIEY